GSWAGASELADGGPDGDVEGVVEAGSGVHEPVDRADEAPDRGGVAAGGAVAVRVGGLDRDLDARLALDDDAVRAVAVRRLRPVGGAGRVDSGDVLDDDAGFALDDALHLEADRSLRALLEVAHGAGSDGLVQREAVHGLANLVQFDAQGVGHQPDLPAPHHGGDGGGEHGRLVVHRLAHADQVPDGVGLV